MGGNDDNSQHMGITNEVEHKHGVYNSGRKNTAAFLVGLLFLN